MPKIPFLYKQKPVLFPSFQLYHLHVGDPAGIEGKAHQRPDRLLTVSAGSPGIDDQSVKIAVIHDLEDMAMAANEHLGRVHLKAPINIARVMARIAADMRKPDGNALQSELPFFRIAATQLLPVGIAINEANGFEGLETVGHIEGENISGMPDLVAIREISKITIVPKTMGIGKESYAFHNINIYISIPSGCVFIARGNGKDRHFARIRPQRKQKKSLP